MRSQTLYPNYGLGTDHMTLQEILSNKKLASLGDSYVNLIFSLALSQSKGEPMGVRVKSRILADALKIADLRNILPRRTDTHTQADASEAFIVYAWLHGIVSLKEGVETIEGKVEKPVEAFSELLNKIKERMSVVRE